MTFKLFFNGEVKVVRFTVDLRWLSQAHKHSHTMYTPITHASFHETGNVTIEIRAELGKE